jgi:hypothetical protein
MLCGRAIETIAWAPGPLSPRSELMSLPVLSQLANGEQKVRANWRDLWPSTE